MILHFETFTYFYYFYYWRANFNEPFSSIFPISFYCQYYHIIWLPAEGYFHSKLYCYHRERTHRVERILSKEISLPRRPETFLFVFLSNCHLCCEKVCGPLWDNASCIPPTPSGQTAVLPCMRMFQGTAYMASGESQIVTNNTNKNKTQLSLTML